MNVGYKGEEMIIEEYNNPNTPTDPDVQHGVQLDATLWPTVNGVVRVPYALAPDNDCKYIFSLTSILN